MSESSDVSVTTWIANLKRGSEDAASQIWGRYVDRLVRVARRKLGQTPRRVADEEDVVLSAFDGFLRGVQEGRFPRLDDRDDLWQVLVMLTERRTIALRRRELALRRGGGGIRGESLFAHHAGDGSHWNGLDGRSSPEPSPAFAAEMVEQVTFLLDRLSDPIQREIARGKLENKTNKELSIELGISLRAVERKLSLIRDTWRGLSDDE